MGRGRASVQRRVNSPGAAQVPYLVRKRTDILTGQLKPPRRSCRAMSCAIPCHSSPSSAYQARMRESVIRLERDLKRRILPVE
jgi:hypothetical protein